MGHGHDTGCDRCDRRIVRRPAPRIAAFLPRISSNDVSQMSWAGMLARVFEQAATRRTEAVADPRLLARAVTPATAAAVPKSDSTVFARTVKLTWP
jgi:hypothetical protein